MTDADLVKQVLDVQAIQALLSRFDLAANDGDVEALAATWAADGVWEMGEPHPLRAVGIAKIREAFKALGVLNRSFFRITGQATIHVQGDQAAVRSPTLEIAKRSAAGYRNLATYHDRAVRDLDGQWRFAERRYEYLLVDDLTPVTGVAFPPTSA